MLLQIDKQSRYPADKDLKNKAIKLDVESKMIKELLSKPSMLDETFFISDIFKIVK